MSLYPGRSPFQSAGLVWLGGCGMVKSGDTVTGLGSAPALPFTFDQIEADAAEAKKSLGGAETALTHAEIVSVFSFLSQATGQQFRVNGVTADGHYLANVPPDQVVQIVDGGPNVDGNWRWDFTLQQWVLIHCVDAQGDYLGNVPDGQFAAIVPSAPPAAPHGETWRWNGSVWVDSRSVADILSHAKTAAKDRIDADAEATRLKYITTGSGQAMTYNEKLAEARLILVSQASQDAANAMDSVTLQATYPMIAACIGIDGATASAVATTVQASWAAWAQIGGKIEKKRRDAKAAIGAATTVEAVTAAANVDWTIA